jgi:HK97 family phage major capsid protein
MTLAEMRAARLAAQEALRALHAGIGEAEPTPEQATRWEELETEERDLGTQIAESEETEARAQRVRDARSRFGGHNVKPTHGKDDDDRIRSSNPMATRGSDIADCLMRSMEGSLSDHPAETGKRFEQLVRKSLRQSANKANDYQVRSWAHRLAVRATDTYASAWGKYVTGDMLALTGEEGRAISVGSNEAGGYLLPTQLDPTIIITNDGAVDVVRALVTARGGHKTMIPGTGNRWHGITSAGVSGSWDTEGSAVSEDDPTFGQPYVDINMGRAFATATFQALTAINNVEGDLMAMFADTKNRMEAAVHVTGTGSDQPTGIVTDLHAITACRVVTTTAAEIGVVDINAIHRGLPIRWRGNGAWLMNPLFADAIQALGTSLGVAYTGSIADDYNATLKNKPWRQSDDMPATVTTTALDTISVFGDFGGMIIVDRPGTMAVEFIQNMMDPTTGTPTSKRGWLCWWEHGSKVINPAALRLLVDKTSA